MADDSEVTLSSPREACRSLRDLVNDNRRIKSRLMREANAWREFCSSLDVVGDTESALDSYLGRKDDQDPRQQVAARDYLRVYGALQALVVQQDAVRAIAKMVGPSAPGHAEATRRLQEIRNIRNLSIGHPTRAAKQPGKPSSFIVQVSLDHGGFDLLSLYDDGRQETRRISLVALIADQRAYLANTICRAYERLRDQDRKHKKEHLHVNLTDIFSEVSYHLGKTFDLIHSNEGALHTRELGRLHLPPIVQAFEEAEAALRKRGDFDAHQDTLVSELALARHCIARLHESLNKGMSGEEARMDAEAFFRALSSIVEGFRPLLQELDEEYNAD